MPEARHDPSAWIGRRSERTDAVSTRLVVEFRAAMSPYLAEGEAVPPGLFWCLAPDALTADLLGGDGHPRLGVFLPDVPLPQRMWAGGELLFSGAFAVGDVVRKTGTIENVAFKAGSSGPLCFVTVRNHYVVDEALIVDERQDIVYREPPIVSSSTSPVSPGDRMVLVAAEDRWIVQPDPIMLFRFSAVTFNGHRIHYDWPYATGVEGYDGLVVHGPMQAVLMLNLAAHRMGRLPRRFSYRGLAPLICGDAFAVEFKSRADGHYETQIVTASNVRTMSAAIDRDEPPV